MAHWRGEYFAALAVRDRGEKVNIALYDACSFHATPRKLRLNTNIWSVGADTRLADRTATLATPTGTNAGAFLDQQFPNLKNDRITFSPTTTTSKKQPLAEKGPGPTEILETTRADLAEAQRSRSELEARLNRVNAEVEKLRYKNNQDGRRLKALENDRVHLQLRLKDREEELRGKAKLLEVGRFSY